MSDMTEEFDFLKREAKLRKKANLQNANPEGWTQHTEFHWSRILQGDRMDYWPSTNRFRYRGVTRYGGVEGYIRNRS
jgi:hypothetical protein